MLSMENKEHFLKMSLFRRITCNSFLMTLIFFSSTSPAYATSLPSVIVPALYTSISILIISYLLKFYQIRTKKKQYLPRHAAILMIFPVFLVHANWYNITMKSTINGPNIDYTDSWSVKLGIIFFYELIFFTAIFTTYFLSSLLRKQGEASKRKLVKMAVKRSMYPFSIFSLAYLMIVIFGAF